MDQKLNGKFQFSMVKTTEWKIGSQCVKLRVDQANVASLDQQTDRRDLLSRLVERNCIEASRCALDLIFQWGHFCTDTKDALVAYSYLPVSDPPEVYLKMFSEVDWSQDHPTEALRAIILAGMKDKSGQLLSILSTLDSDFRDAALFAASSFVQPVIIEKVGELVVTTGWHDAFETGEMFAFATCFHRWLQRNIINITQVGDLLKRHQSANPKMTRAAEFLSVLKEFEKAGLSLKGISRKVRCS